MESTILASQDSKDSCHDSEPWERCYQACEWAKTVGVKHHPEWYPDLSESSSLLAFQMHFYVVHEEGNMCPLPCGEVGATSRSADPARKSGPTADCFTAQAGDRCYEAVNWAMSFGIMSHPEWYPGLTSESSFEDFQAHLHETREKDGACREPCRASTAAKMKITTTAAPSAARFAAPSAARFAAPSPARFASTETSTTAARQAQVEVGLEERGRDGMPWQWPNFRNILRPLFEGANPAKEIAVEYTATTTTVTATLNRGARAPEVAVPEVAVPSAVGAPGPSSSLQTVVETDPIRLRVMEYLEKAKQDSAVQCGVSLFCFAVMVPWGNERDLLREAYTMNAGIFSCEDTAIYSSEAIEIVPGVTSIIARDSLKCKYGGEFKTALNTDIFIDIWRTVVRDDVYSRNDWTVKVDPDAVFFAHRLRCRLQPLMNRADKEPMYINNCKLGMHGPFEVVSRRAVLTWYEGMDRCVSYFRRLCSGDCLWGEDMFLDQCYQRVLNVTRINMYDLLLEDHCYPPKGWDSCHSMESVAFHPFKSPGNFTACLERAILDRHRSNEAYQ